MQQEVSPPAMPPADGPARDRVYAYVREGILRREIEPGTFLEEELVSSAVGVSRTPVREAFHRLAAERWLELLPRRGALVRRVTAQELVEVYEVRRLIEAHAARTLCREARSAPKEARDLHKSMCRQDATSVREHVALDHAFHRALVAAAGNAVLLETYDGLRSRQHLVALSAFGADPSRLQTILAEHGALLDAIDARDPAAATQILDRHLRPLADVIARLAG